jgi:cytochrome c-type biogenesis protein CcmH
MFHASRITSIVIMKAKSFLKLTLILLIITYFLFVASFILRPSSLILAQSPDADRVNEIAKKLNCPTCQGLNLADCRTQTCAQWRDQIGDLVAQGYSNQEVLDYYSARYGDQVLQEPPKHGFSLALWLLPVLALIVGGVWLVYTLRRWRQVAPPPASVATSSTADTDDDYLRQVEQDIESTN